MANPRITYDGGTRTIDFPHRYARPAPRLEPTRRVEANLAEGAGAISVVSFSLDEALEFIWDASLTYADFDLRRKLINFKEFVSAGEPFSFAADSADAVQTTLNGSVAKDDSTITVTSATGFVVGGHYKIVTKDHSTLFRIASGGISGNVITPEETIHHDYADGVMVRSEEYWPICRLRFPLEVSIVDVTPLRWTYILRLLEFLS